MTINEKKCKSGSNCCKKCKKKKALGWGNPEHYGAIPTGDSTIGIGESTTDDILELLLREYIRTVL